jgi:membrane protein DedA with SNARE-associated domain
MWPLSSNPALMTRGVAFFERWGVVTVLTGRFFGPLRAIVPIAAGLCGMPRHKFQIANIASAIVWAAGILAPGAIGMG